MGRNTRQASNGEPRQQLDVFGRGKLERNGKGIGTEGDGEKRMKGEAKEARNPERTGSRRGRILVTSIFLYPEWFGGRTKEGARQGD